MADKPSAADIAISVVLVLIGLYYALAPHSLHVSSGFGFGLDHTMHILIGVILLVAGAGYYASKSGMLKK